MNLNEIENLFTDASGEYNFARWERPIAPIVFGVDDATLVTAKSLVQAMCLSIGHHAVETDPEMGSNLMMFFFRDWTELLAVPDLDQMIPNLQDLVARLDAQNANQYRGFRFEKNGAIRAAFVLIRMDDAMANMNADDLILGQLLQVMTVWGPNAFADHAPLVQGGDGPMVVRPEITDVLRMAYLDIMPTATQDKTHAMRIAARVGAL